MLQQLPTTDVATTQRALDLHRQGRGPHLMGNFLGKGFVELVAIRRGSGKYLEGQCSSCHENEWYEVTDIFYET
ncbi:MAG TPA: hypothetical protein VL485_19155 [Ktedonobacteraceae bacterium]|jgi:hypothetical protein|nr:hypothetical protein [Ktedonobacteraceae bacterium]